MLPVRLSRQMGRVKNRRNSDRIGWNSMWDNHTTTVNEADELNEQTLASLNVTDGGLIHCAVRPAQPLPLHSTARQQAPPIRGRLHSSCLSIPAPQPGVEPRAGGTLTRAVSLAGAAAAR